MSDFKTFLGANKKFWLTPIIVIFTLVVVLLIVMKSSSYIAPLFYTVF